MGLARALSGLAAGLEACSPYPDCEGGQGRSWLRIWRELAAVGGLPCPRGPFASVATVLTPGSGQETI